MLSTSLLLALICLCVPLGASFADDENLDDEYISSRFDFTALLKVRRLDELTDYRGCTLKPVGEIAVAYKARPRSDPKQVMPETPYEDLWYHDFTPIGCRRYRAMPPECTGFGVIKVLPSSEAGMFAGALANATIRLLLDMNVRGCACNVIIVPREIFGAVYTSFSRFGFQEVTTRPENAIPGRIILTIMSDPASEEKRVYYHDPVW